MLLVAVLYRMLDDVILIIINGYQILPNTFSLIFYTQHKISLYNYYNKLPISTEFLLNLRFH